MIKDLFMPVNLQRFADGDDDLNGGAGDNLSGDEMLANAIKSLLNDNNNDDDNENDDNDDNDDNQDDDTDDTDDDDNNDDDDDTVDDDNDDDQDNDDDDDHKDENPTDKKKQSKEDNARFAKERREREARERAEAELERLKQESPEFKLAEMLSKQFGQPVEKIMEQIQEEALKQEAKQRNVPIEELREKQQLKENQARLEKELNLLKFQGWQRQMEIDGSKIMSEYKMLTKEDIDKATDYILTVAKNVELPLEDAVFAVHGKKIAQALAKGQQQEDLANASGRKKKTPLPPNNSKSKKQTSLTADEQAIARAFGMSDEEYTKYKS